MSSAVPTLDISGTRPIPFWRLVLVEFRKSYDTRSGFWMLVTIGLLVTLTELAVLIGTLVNEDPISLEDFALLGSQVALVFLPVLGILVVTSEWSQRTAMVSFAIEPRRMRVVLAKLAVGAALAAATVVAMFFVGAIYTTVCEVIQPEQTTWGFDWWLIPALLFVLTLTMTVGFSLAALILNTPTAIVVFFLYWWVLTIVLYVIAGIVPAFEDAIPWLTFQASLDPIFTWSLDTAEEWGQMIVSGGLWIVLPLCLGLWRIVHAEVK